MSLSNSFKANGILAAAVILSIAGQSMQNLSAPLWHSALPTEACTDAFVMYLVMITWYPIMFFVTSVVIRLAKRQSPLGFVFRFSLRQHGQIILTGLSDALNGALVIPASPSERTPAIVAALIGNTTLLPMIVIKHFFFRVRSLSVYRHRLFSTTILLYLAATYTLVYPVIHNGAEANAKVLWWLVFFFGAIFGNFYNMQQEKSFKDWKLYLFQDQIEYLFWQTFYLFLWGFALSWMDIIPGFGDAVDRGMACSLRDTFRFSFMGMAFLYNTMFNVGYYITYIAAASVNKSDALIGTVSSIAVTAVVTAVAYPSDVLTPDRSVVMIGLVPLTVLLTALATVSFVLWSRETAAYDNAETVSCSNDNDADSNIQTTTTNEKAPLLA